jgi:thiamine-phosphate pyrophosphorylase
MRSRRARNSGWSAREGSTSLRAPHPPLLLITDRRQARLPLHEVVAAALGAGCRWISLREKDLPQEEQAALARALLPLVHRYRACLTLHGDAALAAACGCGGVHLPAGADAAAARVMLGRDKLIGLSLHTVAEAAAIDPAAVDYALAGPAFATASKPGYRPAAAGLIADIARAAPVPVLAIGGLSAPLVVEVLAAGCAGIAVMGGVMRASDPGGEVRALLAALAASPSPGRGPSRGG